MEKNRIFISIFFIVSLTTQLHSQIKLNVGDSLQKEIVFRGQHEYYIEAEKGEFHELTVFQDGIDLIVTVLNDKGYKLEFDSPNEGHGPAPFSFQSIISGDYKIIIKPFEDSTANTQTGNYSIQYLNKIDAHAYAKILKQELKEEKEFVQWIKTNSSPIKTVVPENGFDDLEPLKQVLQNKRVVGLGEATHGTMEFFQMKHRMLEFLVKEMGFTVFAIEASSARCKYINNYILNGIGDIDTAVAIQGFWCWRTEEVKELINWMKRYNDSNPVHKIYFEGFDIQFTDAASYELSKMYAKIEPEKKPEIDSLLKSIVRAEKNGGIFYGDSSVIELKKSFEKLFYSYIHKKGQYLLQIPLSTYEENFWNHRLLAQFLDEYCTPENDMIYDRDFYMAQNIFSILNKYGEDTKMVVWAHNAHIAKKDGWATTPTMGYYLNQVLGDNYYCIGFDFYQGKFQSIDMGPVDIPGPVAFEVPEAPRGNLSWYFAQTGLDKCFVDLTSTEKSETIGTWINNKEIGMYFMASGFSNTWLPGSYIMPAKLLKSFDGLIFIRETNRDVPKEKIAINNFKF